MPNSEENSPNEELLIEYEPFSRINSFDEFLSVSHQLPQQVAIWRSSFFHHFIYMSKTYDTTKNAFIIEFVHKINKQPLQMAGSLLSMLDADFISRVAIKKAEVVYENGTYELKKGKSLLDIKSGVYFLGDYDYETREKAKERALRAIGAHEIYSGQSCNCEHFSNWCFRDNPISYQANTLNYKAVLADASLNACKDVTGLAVTGLVKQSVFTVGQQIGVSSASGIGSNIAKIALSPIKSSAIGVIIQAPIEAACLTHSCLKMKKAVKEGMMTQSDMNREVTKNVVGSAGSLAASFGGAVAGAAVGTCILPGAGTVVGGAIGGIVGGIGGKFGGTLLGAGAYKVAHKAKNKIKKYKNRKRKNNEENEEKEETGILDGETTNTETEEDSDESDIDEMEEQIEELSTDEEINESAKIEYLKI